MYAPRRVLGVVEFESPDFDPRATVDEARIGQVIRNLLSNAAKFSPEGGTISMALSRDGDSFRLSIRDEGPGIPDDELEAVFDKFVQSSKTKSGAGGTGLGLSICRQIVDAYNGRIWAENRPEGGAVFHVEENTVIARHGVLRFRAGGRGCLAGEPGSADRLEFFNDELVFDKIPDAGFLEFAPAVNEHALFKTGRFVDFTTELLTFFFRTAVDHCEV